MITQNNYEPREDSFDSPTKNGLVILSQQLCNIANEMARRNRLEALKFLMEHQYSDAQLKSRDIVKILEEYVINDGTKT